MSLSKKQDLVNASINMNRSVWAMNLGVEEIESTSFKNGHEIDKYIYECVGECLEDLKIARKRYGAVIRRDRKKENENRRC